MDGEKVIKNGMLFRDDKKMSEKMHSAKNLQWKAEETKKRRWRNGWRKPKLVKAGQRFNEAALLFCQENYKEDAKKALLSAYECFKAKRDWFR